MANSLFSRFFDWFFEKKILQFYNSICPKLFDNFGIISHTLYSLDPRSLDVLLQKHMNLHRCYILQFVETLIIGFIVCVVARVAPVNDVLEFVFSNCCNRVTFVLIFVNLLVIVFFP